MTSHELTPGFHFGHVVIPHGRDACPPNLVQIALSNSELSTFSEIQDGGRRHLVFSLCEFGTFLHVNSVVLELCIKFGSNVCYTM